MGEITEQNHWKNQKKTQKPKFRATMESSMPCGIFDASLHLARNFGFLGFFWFFRWFYSVILAMAQIFQFFWFSRMFCTARPLAWRFLSGCPLPSQTVYVYALYEHDVYLYTHIHITLPLSITICM